MVVTKQDAELGDLARSAPTKFAGAAGAAARQAKTQAQAEAPPRPVLSVVLPVHNEQDNLPELHRRLTIALEAVESYELIFVDDGSRDGSAGIVASFASSDPRTKLLRLSRNFGHQAAMAAGLDHARGQAVVLMDTDLQDPPEVIADMVAAWRDGAEVVYAVRQARKEHAAKRACYHLFYRLVRWLSAPLDVPLDSGDFCLLDRRVADAIVALSEQKTFLRGLRSWVGFKQVPLEYERHGRYAGDASYTFAKLRKLALDGIIACSSRPLRLASYLGLGTLVVAALYLVAVVGGFFIRGTAPAGWTSLMGAILLLGGAQLLVLGVLSEYVARIVEESRARPNYLIATSIGLTAVNDQPEPPL
ncbi:MAG: glycosyltransferase family 2 protein [Acidimicrobiales bacterium]